MRIRKSKAEVALEKQSEDLCSYAKWLYGDMVKSFFKALVAIVLGSYLLRHRAEVRELLSTIPAQARGAVSAWVDGSK